MDRHCSCLSFLNCVGVTSPVFVSCEDAADDGALLRMLYNDSTTIMWSTPDAWYELVVAVLLRRSSQENVPQLKVLWVFFLYKGPGRELVMPSA